jgi:hypothetical protein
VTAPRSAPQTARSSRPARRLRLLAFAAAPLALVGTVLSPAAASGHTTAPAARPASNHIAVFAGTAQRPLPLRGRYGPVTVTLITGDRVTVTQAPGGRDTATPLPGPGSSPLAISEQTGPGGVTTSLQAIPQASQQLIGTGQVNQGLFDLMYLAAHGDTGPQAHIPITIAYAGHPTAAQLRADAARLPGAAVQAVQSGSGQVHISVPASQAAAFWAALTSPAQATTASASIPARPSLADGATQVWLTGHQAGPAASPQPQDGQPLYTVTETITRTTGQVVNPGFQCDLSPDQQGNITMGPLCFNSNSGQQLLWGVAGPGTGMDYPALVMGNNGHAYSETCVDEKPATPFPVCSAWQLSFSVPAGVYFAQSTASFLTTDNTDHTLEEANLELDLPQLTVTGNTSFTLNADQAVPVAVATPQSGEQWWSSVTSARQLPDGTSQQLIQNIAPDAAGLWAVPTPAGGQATIGQYSYAPELSLQRPPVTATTSAPGHPPLHLLYAECSGDITCQGSVARFSGSQSLQLVNAGMGTASDFSKINARGKLVMISFDHCSSAGQNPYFPGKPCLNLAGGTALLWQQLENALQAGAAGVLFDVGTINRTDDPNHLPAQVRTDPAEGGPGLPVPDIPVAAIDDAEGNSLLGQLADGPVTVTIHDSGQTPYAYFLSFAQEGRITGSLNYTVSNRQLAEINNSYHSASPPSSPNMTGGVALRADHEDMVGPIVDVTGTGTVREYYGPLSPSEIWELGWFGAGGGTFTWKVFDHPGSSVVDWNEAPAAPGAPAPYTDVYQAQPDWQLAGLLLTYLNLCVACVQGGTFYPFFYDVNGANPGAVAESPYGFAPGSIHLYNSAGQEIQPTPLDGLATYQLPAQQARYTLVTPTTTWDFSSAEPAADQTPAGTFCAGVYFGVSTAPCQADPLVFLRYDAGLSLANTITPGRRQLQVTGYHQDPSAPPVTSLKLWTSTDGGKTWQPAQVTGGRDGTFTAAYTVPASATGGSVSIKAQAADAAGNDITQEIDNAYGIAASAGSQGR